MVSRHDEVPSMGVSLQTQLRFPMAFPPGIHPTADDVPPCPALGPLGVGGEGRNNPARKLIRLPGSYVNVVIQIDTNQPVLLAEHKPQTAVTA